jgi:chemotaxis protein MotB
MAGQTELAPAREIRARDQPLDELAAPLRFLIRGHPACALAVEAAGLLLTLRGPDVFSPGGAEIKAGVRPLLRGVAEILRGTSRPVRIEGHSDDLPVRSGKFLSNWDLSAARALAVLHLLIQGGVPPARLSLAAHAEHLPAASNGNRAGRARNRRVEMWVL